MLPFLTTRTFARKGMFSGTCILLVCGLPLYAQMHKVEKPERVTRAIGVYEWTGDLKKPEAARLIPVSLFLEGHFEDAGVYLAQPVPFTLQTGDVYSVEKAGQSLGLLDIEYARDIVTKRAAADDDPVGAWYGYGTFAPPAAPKKSNLHASAKLPTVVGGGSDDDGEPHFVVRSGAKDTGDLPAGTTTKPAVNGKSSDTASTTPNPAPDDDPDRPTLRHRDPQEQAKRKKEKEGGSVIPLNTSLNDDPDRPVMRRGVPEEELVPKQLSGLPPNLHQTVAVSDAVNRDPHVFTRDWESAREHDDTLEEIESKARPLIAAYLTRNKLQPVVASAGPSFASTPAKPAATAPSAHKPGKNPVAAPTPQPEFALTSEELKGYLLTYGGLPTFVYTTEVPVAAGGPVYLTMVAQRLPSGELQVALSSVTDATHMDRVPWMRPVDVVDPDASHRASLLMELRAQSSRQFALYGLVTAKAEQTFVTGVIE